MLIRCGTAHNRQDHAKTRARNAKAHKNFQKLMRAGRDRISRKNQASRIHQSANDNGFAIPEFLSNRAKNRLPHAPSKVLDGKSQRKLCAQPTKFVRYGNLKNPKTCSNGKADHNDKTAPDEDGGENRIALHLHLSCQRPQACHAATDIAPHAQGRQC